MKRTLITSIGEYENISSEVGSIEEARQENENIHAEFSRGKWELVDNSWRDRDFNKKLDNYLQTNTMSADDYEGCDTAQKMMLQVIKRAFKRIKETE